MSQHPRDEMATPANQSSARPGDRPGATQGPSITERVVQLLAGFAGSASAHWMAIGLIVVWMAAGPVFADWEGGYHFMEQLVASLSFLMLFILQQSQNKDTMALQLKLDELVASNPKASNRVLNAENITDQELEEIKRHFATLDRLSREAGEQGGLTEEHAHQRHEEEQRELHGGSEGSEDPAATANRPASKR